MSVTEEACEHQPRVYTVDQIAEILGMGRSTTYDAVRRGEIPHVRVGRRLLVPGAKFAQWLGEAEKSDRAAVEAEEVAS